jgi:hypothetical protein
VREFMKVHTKADEDSVAIAEAALHDIAEAGATLVDPGPKGAWARVPRATSILGRASRAHGRDAAARCLTPARGAGTLAA